MAKTSPQRSPPRVIWQTGAALAVVAAITYLGFRVVPVNATTEGFSYLIAILFLSTGWGLIEGLTAAIFAAFCLNYFFFPPVGTLTIENPQDWVALFAFLITAITASRLSAQAKRRALEVLDKQRELERLYALSRGMLFIEPSAPVAKQVANQVAQAFEAPAVVLYSRLDDAYYRAGPAEFPLPNQHFQQAALEGTQFHQDSSWIAAIRLGGDPIGSIGVSGVELTESAIQSLTNLAAIGLEQARVQKIANRAEAARQSDELKSTLLDAIAHEFQTPLTTIKAVTSALLSARAPAPEYQAEMLQLVDQESRRLSSLVSDAIQMSRIEAGAVRLNRERISAAALVENVLQQKQSAVAERQVSVDIPASLPDLWVDPELIALALRQFVDNAAKYSGVNSAIHISAQPAGEMLILASQDHGQGIPETDLPHIFDKFYRGQQSKGQISGAGLGLGIAKAVVEAHGGKISAHSRAGEGTEFRIALPARKEQKP